MSITKVHKSSKPIEPLHPELEAALYYYPGIGRMIKHPLVFVVCYDPKNHDFYNQSLKKLKELKERTHKEKRWFNYLLLHQRPFRITALLEIQNQLSNQDYWRLFAEIVTDTNNFWEWKNTFRRIITKNKPEIEYMMNKREQRYFGSLPNAITIYRGCNRKNRHGFSWSLSKKVARKFSTWRNTEKPIVRIGQCNKSDVIAYLSHRAEREILIFPENVFDIIEERVKLTPSRIVNN